MMRKETKSTVATLALLAGVSFLLVACPASLDDRCADGACDPSVRDATAGGDAGDAATDGPMTDPCVSMPSAPQCLSDATALFVSGSKGNDATGVGTRDKPFKTLTNALGKLTAAKKRVYVCDGTYPEDIALTSSHSGASLFGGFTCDWQASKARPTFGKSALALKITGASGVALSDLTFHAADNAAGSSIAAFVAGGDVTFQRVTLEAGIAGDGENGKLALYTLPAALDIAGINGDNGAGPKTVSCPGGDTTVGGAGGASGFPGGKGTPGGVDNSGQMAACASGGMGGIGAVGTSPPAGPGATVSGELTSAGWLPKAGTAGTHGGAGQGGGGGYGAGGGLGGGGGAGGCGGAGGGGGSGGGASIALAVVGASVRLDASSLTTKKAGAGGMGVAGQPGTTPGGFGGARQSATAACAGGDGGPGGNGAAGGGGAGGISVGVLYKGAIPKLDSTTTAAITTGAKGAPGPGPDQNAGVDGVAAPTLEIK